MGRRLWRQQPHRRAIRRCSAATISPRARRVSPAASTIVSRPTRWWVLRSPAAAPIGASRTVSAAARAMRSRPASTARRVRARPTWRRRFAFTNHWMSTDRFAFAGDHLTASFNAQSLGARVESGYRFATMFGGIAPYAAIQAQSFRTPTYSETDVNGGGFALGYNGRTGDRHPQRARRPLRSPAGAQPQRGAGVAGPARLGARLGERSDARPPCSRRFRARASSSTARRRRRTPRSPRPAPSFASPTASRSSASSTASSPAAHPPMPERGPCDIRGEADSALEFRRAHRPRAWQWGRSFSRTARRGGSRRAGPASLNSDRLSLGHLASREPRHMRHSGHDPGEEV